MKMNLSVNMLVLLLHCALINLSFFSKVWPKRETELLKMIKSSEKYLDN